MARMSSIMPSLITRGGVVGCKQALYINIGKDCEYITVYYLAKLFKMSSYAYSFAYPVIPFCVDCQ